MSELKIGVEKSKALILGSGSNLITQQRLRELGEYDDLVVLGGNLTFIRHNLDYFFSSYEFHCGLCEFFDTEISIVKFSTVHERSTWDTQLEKTHYFETMGIHPGLIEEGYVSTEFNQLIGMTHFATTLGIKEILYSGFHQKDYRYFWQLEHEALSKVDKLVKHYLEHREAAGILTSKDDERVLDNILDHLANIDSFEEYGFYNNSILKAVFSDLEALGIDFRSLDCNGIITEVLSEG